MIRHSNVVITTMLAAMLAASVAAAQPERSYSPVTDARLESPEPGNWLMYLREYNSWGYSPLDQITTKNVKKLMPAWTFSTGVEEGHQSPPIVNNGVMFITTPKNQVLALDARTGDLLWRYRRELTGRFVSVASHQPWRGAVWG